MRLLLDTHVWLWLTAEPERVSRAAHEQITSQQAQLSWSAVTVWEIAVKQALGKLPIPEPAADFVRRGMAASGARALSISHQHALRVAELPLHHRDPFDRLLVAQAQVEGLTLVTADPQVQRYDVDLLPA